MIIVDLALQPESIRDQADQAADLLVRHFDQPLGWPNLKTAREEVARVLREGLARAMLDSQTLVGLAGDSPNMVGGFGNSIPWLFFRTSGSGELAAHWSQCSSPNPFWFNLKLGFVITDVMPDANGPGRPDEVTASVDGVASNAATLMVVD
jgi:hypothetical protein